MPDLGRITHVAAALNSPEFKSLDARGQATKISDAMTLFGSNRYELLKELFNTNVIDFARVSSNRLPRTCTCTCS